MPTVGPSESPIARRANAPSLSPTTTALLVMKLVASVVIADELQGQRKSRESPIARDECFPKIGSNGPRMLSTGALRLQTLILSPTVESTCMPGSFTFCV